MYPCFCPIRIFLNIRKCHIRSLLAIPHLTSKISLMLIVSISNSKCMFFLSGKNFFFFWIILSNRRKSLQMTRRKRRKKCNIWFDNIRLYFHLPYVIDTVFEDKNRWIVSCQNAMECSEESFEPSQNTMTATFYSEHRKWQTPFAIIVSFWTPNILIIFFENFSNNMSRCRLAKTPSNTDDKWPVPENTETSQEAKKRTKKWWHTGMIWFFVFCRENMFCWDY